MRRLDRLMQLLQLLRRARQPVTAEHLAGELEVSQRTIYRDIAGLIDNGYYRSAVVPSDPLEDPTGLVAAIITIVAVTAIAIWLSSRRLERLNLE